MTCNLFYYVTKSITIVSFKKAGQKNTILSIETVNVSGVLCKCGHTVAVLCEFSRRESLRAAGFHHRDYQHHRFVCSTWVCLCVSLCVPYCNYWALFMKHKQNRSVQIVALCKNRWYVNGAVYVGCNLRTIHTQKLVLPSIFCLFCALWYTQRACESDWAYSAVLNRCNSRFYCAVTLSRARARALFISECVSRVHGHACGCSYLYSPFLYHMLILSSTQTKTRHTTQIFSFLSLQLSLKIQLLGNS